MDQSTHYPTCSRRSQWINIPIDISNIAIRLSADNTNIEAERGFDSEGHIVYERTRTYFAGHLPSQENVRWRHEIINHWMQYHDHRLYNRSFDLTQRETRVPGSSAPEKTQISAGSHDCMTAFRGKAIARYDTRGLLASEDDGAGISHDEYDYDNNGRVIEHRQFYPQDSSKPSSIKRFTYDKDGHPVRETETDQNGNVVASRSFVYDNAGRLAEEQFRAYRDDVGAPTRHVKYPRIALPPNAQKVSSSDVLIRTLHFYDLTAGRDTQYGGVNRVWHDENGDIVEVASYDILAYWIIGRRISSTGEVRTTTYGDAERIYASETYRFDRESGVETEEIKTVDGKSIFRRTSRYSSAGRLIGKEEYMDEEYYCPHVGWWPK
jgi:YD repeat-containing protein